MSFDFSMEAMQRCIRSISLSTDMLQPCTMVVAQ